MDHRLASAPELWSDIRLVARGSRNPMDITCTLNTCPSSDSEEDWDEPKERVCDSLSMDFYYRPAPQPMEVDGEVAPRPTTLDYHGSSRPELPSIQLMPCFARLAPRSAQGLRMSQVIRRRDETFRVAKHTRFSARSSHHGSYPCISAAIGRLGTSSSPDLQYQTSVDARRSVTYEGRIRKRKPAGSHPNKPYIQDHVHWIRYHAEDCGLSFAEMYPLWDIQFPGQHRERKQAFSARLYRDNISALLDDLGELIRNEDGKPYIIAIKVRMRGDPAFRDFPFTLWERNPEWALYWDWVSPEHKAMAQWIVDGRGFDDSQRRKERSRQAIRMYEAELPPRKGWFATPALHAAAVLEGKVDGPPKTSSLPSSSPLPSSVPTPMVINLESAQTSYWAAEYELDSNGQKI